MGSIPGLGRSPGEGKGYPGSRVAGFDPWLGKISWRRERLQYSGLENYTTLWSMGLQRVGHD